ncbi:fibronectin type III domain-containing protein [Myroides odoratus]|uniref:fibronectin type III domain-containing protein n=1 Tax=Myroides odoratus TaxID=256 RepID=UPI0039AEB8DF
MKRITVLFFFLLSVFLTYGQEVTIGAGTISQNHPLSSYFGYQRSAALYTAAEINQTGFINRLAWDIGSVGAVRPVKIYLKEIEGTTITAANWTTLTTGATLVYDGSFLPNTTGYRTLNLDISFNYTGETKSLLVLVEANAGGGGIDGVSGLNIKGSTIANMHLAATQDTTAPTGNLTFGNSRPNIKMTFGAQITCPTIALTIAELFFNKVRFNVTERASTTSVFYELRTTGNAGSGATGLVTSGTINDLTNTPFEIAGLTENTVYNLYVRANCNAETSTFSNGLSFRTLFENVIGTGELDDSDLPIHSNFGYNYSQMIYTASEVGGILGTRRLVDRIKFYYTAAAPNTTSYSKWTVFAGNTTQAEFGGTAASNWVNHQTLTKVYTGTLNLATPVGRWVEIVLDTPIIWDGTSNLVLAIYEDSPGFSSGAKFRKFATTTNRAMVKRGDTAFSINEAVGGAASSRFQYLPQLFLGSIDTPTCYRPVNISTNTITNNSVGIAWGILPGVSSVGVDYYIAQTNTPVDETTVATGTFTGNGTSGTINSLQPNTRYYLYLRNKCSATVNSDWSVATEIRTNLVAATLPYTENFENNPNFAFNNDSTNKWHVGNAVNNGGQRALYISNDNGTTNAYTLVGAQVSHVYKDFTIPAGTTDLSISFDWRCVGEGTTTDYFRVWAVPVSFEPAVGAQTTAATDRIRVGRAQYNSNNAFLNEVAVINASVFAGQTMRLVFEWRQDGGGGTQPPAAIDNLGVSIVTCSQPTGLVLNSLTHNTITASWTAVSNVSSYDVYIGTTANRPADNATVTNVTGTTHTFQGLSPLTQYYIWVRSHCSGTSQSIWTGPLEARTGLLPANLPFTETFEGDVNYGYVNDTTNKWHIGNAVNNGGQRAMYISNDNGVTNTYTTAGAQISHVFKDFTVPAGATDLQINFDWRCVGEGGTWDYFRVWVVPVTFTPTVGVQTAAGTNRTRLGRSEYNANAVFLTENLIFDGTVFAGQTMRIVFEWRQDTGGGTQPPAAIDNLKIKQYTCRDVANATIQLSNITTTTGTVAWTSTNVASYDLYLTQSPVRPTDATTPTINVTNPTHTFENLNPGTQYLVYVRSNCGPTDIGVWTGPKILATNMTAATLPYTENFEGITNLEYKRNDTNNKWFVGNAVNNGGTKALYISNDLGATNTYNTTGAQVSHVYKDFVIPTGTLEIGVNFDWRCVGEGGTWDYFRVWLVPDSFIPTTGVQITAATDRIRLGRSEFNGNPEFIREQLTQNANVFAGQTMRLVFEWRQDTGGGTQPPAAIDNLEVAVITCPAPTNLQVVSVTGTTATVSWTPVAGQDTYEVYYTTTNTPPGATVTGSVVTTDNPYTIPGLTPNTDYFVWVRTICSDTDKSFWKRLPVSTGQIPAEMPYEEGFEGDNNWSVISNSVNKWVVGTAVNNGGTRALYVSDNNGVTNTYNNSISTVTHAYRDIAVPNVRGVSETILSFDWRGMGEACCDYIRVWLVPATFRPTQGQQIAAGANRIQIGGNYNQQAEFRTVEQILDLSAYAGTTIRVIFEWRNDGSMGDPPAGAIDNVLLKQITCPTPKNLQAEIVDINVTPINVLLTWEPQGDETQWEVYILDLEDETVPTDATPGIVVNEPRYIFVDPNPNATEDKFYRFYVRPICSPTDKGRWSKPGIISFIPPPGCAVVDAEIEFSDIEGLEKNENGDYVICEDGTFNFTLGASYYDILKTNEYKVEPIEYRPPFPFKGGGAVEIDTDDRWSGVIDLGFDFCFFGNKFDKVLITDNGAITFSIRDAVPDGRYTPNSGSGFSMNANDSLPYSPPPPSTQPLYVNSIFGVMQDLDPRPNIGSPADKSINYQIIGKAPCRTLVFNVYHLGLWTDLFDPENIEGSTQTTQVVLYEGTNIIEVYVKNRPVARAHNGGNGVIGIQNSDGTIAYVPPGRNVGRWTAQREAWRFTPDGDSTAEFVWEKDGEFFSSETSIDISVTETVKYTAKATYEICGEVTELTKEFSFVKEDFSLGTPIDLFDCSRRPGELNEVNLRNNDALVLGDLDPTKYVLEYFDDESSMNNGTDQLVDDIYKFNVRSKSIYVKLTNKTTGCWEYKVFRAYVKDPLPVDKPANQSVCGFYLLPELKEGGDYYTEQYGQGTKYEVGDTFRELGKHTIYVYREDEDGCFGESSFTLEIVEQPVADVIPDQIMYCDVFKLPALSTFSKYYTQPNGEGVELPVGMPIFEPSTIYVFAYNKGSNGAICIDQSSFRVDFEDCPIPKGFSPNGDGLNDSFDLSNHGIAKIQIFNRNGTEVYSHGVGYTKEFVGKDKSGKQLPSGTYYYVVVANAKMRTGWVQINY